MPGPVLLSAFLLPMLIFFGCRREATHVVARVGRSAITETEFSRKLSEVAPDYQNYVVTPHGRRQFLDVLIREKLILEAARAAGIPQGPEFRERIEQLRREEEERLAEARDYLMTRLWIEQLRRDGILKVSDAETADYHRKQPTEVSVRHVLLATAEDAEAVLRTVRSGTSRFAAVAKASSLDADTAVAGGQMKPTLYGEIIPELEVVFKMRVGEVGGPVRSKFGYHVLLKEGERNIPLPEAEERIRNILEKQKLDRHLQSLQASIPVEVVDAQFR